MGGGCPSAPGKPPEGSQRSKQGHGRTVLEHSSHQGSLVSSQSHLLYSCPQLGCIHMQPVAHSLALLGAWLAHLQGLVCVLPPPVKEAPLGSD